MNGIVIIGGSVEAFELSFALPGATVLLSARLVAGCVLLSARRGDRVAGLLFPIHSHRVIVLQCIEAVPVW